MSLVRGTINPFNVLGVRRLSYMPEHFTRMTFSGSMEVDKIDSWIYQNLDSRYSIVKSLKIDSNNKLIEVHELGVEDSKELTILSLSCPYLDKNT
jgi:hypothetical protein